MRRLFYPARDPLRGGSPGLDLIQLNLFAKIDIDKVSADTYCHHSKRSPFD